MRERTRDERKNKGQEKEQAMRGRTLALFFGAHTNAFSLRDSFALNSVVCTHNRVFLFANNSVFMRTNRFCFVCFFLTDLRFLRAHDHVFYPHTQQCLHAFITGTFWCTTALSARTTTLSARTSCCTMGQNQVVLRHQIVLFPLGSRVSEWANKRMSTAERLSKTSSAERANE